MSDLDRPGTLDAIVSSCEVAPGEAPAQRPGDPHRLRFQSGFSWEGVRRATYKEAHDASFRGVDRHELVGMYGEATGFHVRYFEVAPGGHTTHEIHAHAHVIVPIRGSGEVRIGERVLEARPFDIVYVPPGAAHQLSNAAHEPFGFFCVVDAVRDAPRPIAAQAPPPEKAP